MFQELSTLKGLLAPHGKTDTIQGVQRNQVAMHAACAQGDPPGIVSGAVPAGGPCGNEDGDLIPCLTVLNLTADATDQVIFTCYLTTLLFYQT